LVLVKNTDEDAAKEILKSMDDGMLEAKDPKSPEGRD
jgi:hypothetical protein